MAGDPDVLLWKWSVPTLQLDWPCRFSELRAALGSVTPRALALQELEVADLVEREVLTTRPPSTVYRATPAGRRIAQLL
jgi:DNA-binding HxlR family transcriptional regulator